MPPVIFFVGASAARGIIYSHPRRALRDTPRPQNHPRKLCLRGARWWRWAFGCGTVREHCFLLL